MSEHHPSDSTSSALVAALEADAQLVEDGVFTIDFAAARTKLADYRLAEPNSFVLMLVEAAHLLPSCSAIEFHVGTRRTRVRLHGTSLPDQELLELFDAAFFEVESLDSDRARARAGRRLLAIAVHAATGLSSREIEVRSCVAGVRHTLRLRSEEEGHEFELGEQATQEREEHPKRSDHFIELRVSALDLGASSSDTHMQRSLLRARCTYASKPVLLDGELLGHGFGLHDAVEPIELRDDAGVSRGFAGMSFLHENRHLGLVANGVVVERVEMRDWRPGFCALVEANTLPRDLSMTEFVRNDAFTQRIGLALGAYANCDIEALGTPRKIEPRAQQSNKLRSRGRGVLWTLFEGLWGEEQSKDVGPAWGAAIAYLERDAIVREWKGKHCELILKLRVLTREHPPFAHSLRVLVDEDLRYELREGRLLHAYVDHRGEVTL